MPPRLTGIETADRQVFRENVKQYVIKKAMIRAGCCCWYDWQLYSAAIQ